MYLPRHFQPPGPDAPQQLMRDHPLATLVVHGPDGLAANHIPLLRQQDGDGPCLLRGHVARANPLWRQLGDGVPALAIFHGPQAYISPSWYPGKQQTGKVVPTWNYAVVHAHGRLRAIDDPQWLRSFVATLTAEHENRRTPPWAVTDAPPDYIQSMVAAIVGIEMTVERLEGKWKAGQNQPEPNRLGAAQGLRGEGETPMADLMQPPPEPGP